MIDQDRHQALLASYCEPILVHMGNTLVYRATTNDNLAVILKFTDPAVTDVEHTLHHEQLILRDLNHPHVVELHTSRQDFLELEDAGQSLSTRELPLSVETALQIGIQVADGLAYLHSKGIIHRDINPANIAMSVDANGSVATKIIDFGLATYLQREVSFTSSHLEGTLAYIAPEQTGRTSLIVDHRADLYSFGAMLYELLTGSPPFGQPTDDLLPIIAAHLTKLPQPPHTIQPDIPPILSEIVLKLLQKHPHDRYRSASGVKTDLEQCFAQWKQHGQVSKFVLAQSDVPDRLLIPQKIYGRDTEIAAIHSAFARTSMQQSTVVFVSGGPGSGKTTLVQELYIPLTEQRGLFAAGKYDQYRRDVPYDGLVQAFRMLLQSLLADLDVQEWQEQLREAVGPNGQVLSELLPELELLIGPQPPAPTVGAAEAQYRLIAVWQQFVQVFACPEHPLVLFLDDIQWIDSASLDLFMNLLSNKNQSLLIIAAYRELEIGRQLEAAIERLEEQDIVVEHLHLQPLGSAEVQQLLTDTFNYAPPPELAELVSTKTEGNPFFVHEFIRTLFDAGYICREDDTWTYDIAAVRQQAVTENVVDLIVAKVERLTSQSQRLVQIIACAGNQVEVELVMVVAALDNEEQLFELLREPVTASVVLIQRQIHGTMMLRLSHDRVRHAVLRMIGSEELRKLHWTIGKALLTLTPETHRGERLFDIVSHLNQGVPATSARDQQQVDLIALAELNLAAGKMAKTSVAYEMAAAYLRVALRHIDGQWSDQYQLSLAVHLEAAEALMLLGNREGMQQLTDAILANATSHADAIGAYIIRIEAFMMDNKLREGLALARDALATVNVNLPTEPDPAETVQALESIETILSSQSLDMLRQTTPMHDPDAQAAMAVFARILPATYLVMPSLLPILVERGISLLVHHGTTTIAPFLWAAYSVVLSAIGDVARSPDYGLLAIDLLNDQTRQIEGPTRMAVNFMARHWREPLASLETDMLLTYTRGVAIGDLTPATFALFHRDWVIFHGCTNSLLRLTTTISESLDTMEQLGQTTTRDWECILLQAARLWTGDDPLTTPMTLIGTVYNIAEETPSHEALGDAASLFFGPFMALLLACHLGEFEQARQLTAQAETYLASVAGTPYVPLFMTYTALARIGDFSASAVSDELLAGFKATHDQLQAWATATPNAVPLAALLAAERARLESTSVDAIGLAYDQAIQTARDAGFRREQALACVRAASWYRKRGRGFLGSYYLREAYQIYQQWGAVALLRQLRQQFPDISFTQDAVTPSAENITPRSRRSMLTVNRQTPYANSVSIDVESLVNISQALTGEMPLPELLKQIVELMQSNSDAQHVLLLKYQDDGTWEFHAKTTDNGIMVMPEHTLIDAMTIPLSVLNYVVRTRSGLIVADAANDNRFRRDIYVQHRQPRALAAVPLRLRENLLGVAYLENNVVPGVFTEEKLTLLNILAAQAAIGIANRQLMSNIAASEAKYRTLFEESREAILLLAPDGTIQEANTSAHQLFEYTSLPDVSLQSLLLAPDKLWRTLTETGEVRDFALTHTNQDGTTADWNISIWQRLDAQGEVIALHAIIRDITLQKRAAEERIRLENQQEIIAAQRAVIRELSTPLLPVGRGVVVLPLVGTVDTQRAQQVMDTLLEGVARTHATTVILDITGIPTVDTQVAQALIQVTRAVRLLGAEVIMTGIRKQIAQTMVQLGVNLQGITVYNTLEYGIAAALQSNRSKR